MNGTDPEHQVEKLDWFGTALRNLKVQHRTGDRHSVMGRQLVVQDGSGTP